MKGSLLTSSKGFSMRPLMSSISSSNAPQSTSTESEMKQLSRQQLHLTPSKIPPAFQTNGFGVRQNPPTTSSGLVVDVRENAVGKRFGSMDRPPQPSQKQIVEEFRFLMNHKVGGAQSTTTAAAAATVAQQQQQSQSNQVKQSTTVSTHSQPSSVTTMMATTGTTNIGNSHSYHSTSLVHQLHQQTHQSMHPSSSSQYSGDKTTSMASGANESQHNQQQSGSSSGIVGRNSVKFLKSSSINMMNTSDRSPKQGVHFLQQHSEGRFCNLEDASEKYHQKAGQTQLQQQQYENAEYENDEKPEQFSEIFNEQGVLGLDDSMDDIQDLAVDGFDLKLSSLPQPQSKGKQYEKMNLFTGSIGSSHHTTGIAGGVNQPNNRIMNFKQEESAFNFKSSPRLRFFDNQEEKMKFDKESLNNLRNSRTKLPNSIKLEFFESSFSEDQSQKPSSSSMKISDSNNMRKSMTALNTEDWAYKTQVRQSQAAPITKGLIIQPDSSTSNSAAEREKSSEAQMGFRPVTSDKTGKNAGKKPLTMGMTFASGFQNAKVISYNSLANQTGTSSTVSSSSSSTQVTTSNLGGGHSGQIRQSTAGSSTRIPFFHNYYRNESMKNTLQEQSPNTFSIKRAQLFTIKSRPVPLKSRQGLRAQLVNTPSSSAAIAEQYDLKH